jgi:cob(I)alamin adenosyltransferase
MAKRPSGCHRIDMKIYTRTGDDGDTGLFGGARVKKTDGRVCAYGTVDEANAMVGSAHASPALSPWLREQLHLVMRDLFDVGAELATPPDAAGKLSARLQSHIHDARITELERAIDAVDDQVPPLTTFVLPGGSEAAARLHIARTVVRRAEREVVALAAETPVRNDVLRYLNRLSDALFAWARLANHQKGIADVPWTAG